MPESKKIKIKIKVTFDGDDMNLSFSAKPKATPQECAYILTMALQTLETANPGVLESVING